MKTNLPQMLPVINQSPTPASAGKFKPEKPHHRHRWCQFSKSTIIYFLFCFISIIGFFSLYFFSFYYSDDLKTPDRGGDAWEENALSSVGLQTEGRRIILVTGAAGFIGSHVSVKLKRRGDGVVGLDNFNQYYDPNLKRDRQKWLSSEGIFIIEGDINDQQLLEKLFGMVKFTHVMHLAAQAGVRYAIKNPKSYVKSNIDGLVNILEICKSANPKPIFIWASSSSVYGLNKKLPFSEEDVTDNPASLYAATKKAGEEITRVYNHIYGLSVTGLRFFTVYGPWGRPDMACFYFTNKIMSGKKLNVFEGSNHTAVARDFTYIDDIVEGCLKALDSATNSTERGVLKNNRAQYRIFNLGNNRPIPISQVVSMLESILKTPALQDTVDIPLNGDVEYTHANITLAHQELGYQPKTDFHTGLKEFVKWYIGYYKQEEKV